MNSCFNKYSKDSLILFIFSVFYSVLVLILQNDKYDSFIDASNMLNIN